MEAREAFKKYADREGKRDRNIRLQKESREDHVNINPRDELEKAIVDTFDDVKVLLQRGKSDELDMLITMYLNARSYRHDLWVSLLQRSSVSRSDFGDIAVIDFLKQKLNIDVNEIGLTQQKILELSKSPDILFFDEHDKFVLLGDVAVSRISHTKNLEKIKKYMHIKDFIMQYGYEVKHINLIINENLEGCRQSLNPFCNMNIINPTEANLIRTMQYHKVCNSIMTYVKDVTSDLQAFNERLSLLDRTVPGKMEIEIPHSLLTEELVDVGTTLSELDIAKMIYSKMELEYDDFYGDTVEKTIKKMNEIVETNKLKDEFLKQPKSVLKVCSNQSEFEELTNHDLLLEYVCDMSTITDYDVRDYILDLLPSTKQITAMKSLYLNDRKGKNADLGVFGPFQYSRTKNSKSYLTMDLNDKLQRGKKTKNTKTAPLTVNPDDYDNCLEYIERSIDHLGDISKKEPFLDNSWDSKTNFELENSEFERSNYDYVRRTNGAYLAHSMSNFYQRIMHIKTRQGTRDNVYIANNSSFIAVIPKEHGPICNRTCNLPMIFMTRFKKDKEFNIANINEYEHCIESDNYVYYISKLCRLSVDKIAHWDQAGYKMVSACSYLLSTCGKLVKVKKTVCGLVTYLILDGHQKVSEYLDLLKYISFMPFSTISKLTLLAEDKLNLLIKTKMDVWLFYKMKDFIVELSKIDKLDAIKPRVQLFNSEVTRESLGLRISLPSFVDNSIRHTEVSHFIEEISMLYIIRPKHLYGSQFLEASLTQTAEWNAEYEEECKTFGNWCVDGKGDGDYPFDAKFAFSHDAMIHAQNHFVTTKVTDNNAIVKKLQKTSYGAYMHTNCSLRGCTKRHDRRFNKDDIHTTSLESCLNYYQEKSYDEGKCTVLGVANDFIESGQSMEFSMSEKDQRGGGRPIATPTLGAKAALMLIEKPEQAIGTYTDNNIIVEGKHKLSEQCEMYKRCISRGIIDNMTHVYQLTEDQTKFSENDNYRKYIPYISNNSLLPVDVRKSQLTCLKQLSNREHIVHKLPVKILEDKKLLKYINNDQNGVKAIIGWPQGMLNFISTSVHSIADYWITHIYNLVSPDKVITYGLVHSDDSWLTIACNSEESFKKFTLFRVFAKRLFCLKLNIKKLWGSKYLGELISNYNINGNVHLSIAKTLANSFGNLVYQNWVMDVHNQVSSIQQCYRNGAPIPILILLATILRQQMSSCYQIKGRHKELLNVLPIELGGYPDNSAFELGVTGVNCHYYKLLSYLRVNQNSDVYRIVSNTLRISKMYKHCPNELARVNSKYNSSLIARTKLNQTDDVELLFKDVDFENVVMPSRGEIFSCIKHIIPKTKKLNKTLEILRAIPYETDNLELIITRPHKLSDALGHLKAQTNGLIYALAAEKFTQNTRKLAVAQAIQSSGKVVKICDNVPMTMNEMLEFLIKYQTGDIADIADVSIALSDDTDISLLCENVVYHSTDIPSNNDKRKIINKIPKIEDKFNTVSRIQNVLLYMVDTAPKNRQKNTNYLKEYSPNHEPFEILENDARLLHKRFNIYFKFYTIEYACNLIMQQYFYRMKARLWMQPYLRSDNMQNFIEDLYGKTINQEVNYIIKSNTYKYTKASKFRDDINTIYTMSVLNTIYPGCFTLRKYKGLEIDKFIKEIDYSELEQDDYLKYSVLQMIHNDDKRHIKQYDSKRIYDQKYLVKQTYTDKGYVGFFRALVRYGRTILLIEGEPSNVTVRANRNNIVDILYGMYLFVLKNFKMNAYQHPNLWYNSEFWNFNNSFVSKTYLTAYSNSVTLITMYKTLNSIPFILDEYLKMEETYNDVDTDNYILDETLRVITKKVRLSHGEQEIKVASIPQGLAAPTLAYCELVPEVLEGYSNMSLLKDKLIINLTLKRYCNCSVSYLMELIESSLDGIGGRCLLNYVINIINSFGNIDIPVVASLLKTTLFEKEYEITGSTVMGALSDYDGIDPSSLEHIETEYVIDYESKAGAIHQYKNFTRLFANIITSGYKTIDTEYIIFKTITDPLFSEFAIKQLNSLTVEYTSLFNELEEEIRDFQFDIMTGITIVGLNLDVEETWDKINMEDILKQGEVSVSRSIINTTEVMLNDIYENILGKKRVNPTTRLLQFFKKSTN